MKADITLWNCGLLFAALSVVLGVAGIVSLEGLRDRCLASGIALQGIVLMFAAGVACFPGSFDLRLGGLTVTCLLIIQHLLMPVSEERQHSQEENQST